MLKYLSCSFIAVSLCLSAPTTVIAKESNLHKVFQGYNNSSELSIGYQDLDLVLKNSVVDMGRSNRRKAKSTTANTGTRMKNKVSKLTANEANRFFFEGYKTPESKQVITNIRESLEQLPSEVALKYFSKDEQLAYWLNLYNVTVLDELLKLYPEKRLDDFIEDDDGVLNQKILTVAGQKLSLNDIQYHILFEKFDGNPLVLYGLFQGNIGSPNIRKKAFTGKNVWYSLKDNADEFINSNRGTYAQKKTFRIAEFYKRNKKYFPNFKSDVKKHILTYLSGSMRYKLEDAKKVKANIKDWKIADVYGTNRKFGIGVSTNNAALLGAVTSNYNGPNVEGSGSGVGAANIEAVSTGFLSKSPNLGRFSAEQIELLNKLNTSRAIQHGKVTIKDVEDKTGK